MTESNITNSAARRKRGFVLKPTGRKPMRVGALLLKEVSRKAADGVTYYKIQATWRDPERRKHWFNNWRHAEEFARGENERLDELKEKGAGRYKFNDAIDSYLEERERLSKIKDSGFGPDTFEIYRGLVENHLRPRFGNMRLTAISSLDVKNWLTETREKTALRTAHHRLLMLKLILNHAVEHDMLVVNPLQVKKVTLPGKLPKRKKIPDRSGLDTLREYINGPRPLKHSRIVWSSLRLIVVLGASCGLRVGEISALEWDDIDRETGEINITKARAHRAGLKGPKTEAGLRKVPTGPSVRKIIDEHAEIYKQLFGKCVGPVMKGRDGNFMPALEISHKFTDVMRQCGLVDPDTNRTKFSHHALRHWTASHWMKSTSDVHQSAKWMGHKNASMTLDTYGHYLDDPEARAKFERMPDWLSPTIEIEPPPPSQPLALEFQSASESQESASDGGAAGPIEPECPWHIPSIAEPWVKPFVNMLYQGTPIAEAYDMVLRQLKNKRGLDETRPITLSTAWGKVTDEFARLKFPPPKSLAARFRAERILKLHGEKHQVLDIARMVGCDPSRVYQVLRPRHKTNPNNPLNVKVIPSVAPKRKPQPEHKTQLKLL